MIGYDVPLPVVTNTKLPALPLTGGPLIVKLFIAPFIVTSKTLPLLISKSKSPGGLTILTVVNFS